MQPKFSNALEKFPISLCNCSPYGTAWRVKAKVAASDFFFSSLLAISRPFWIAVRGSSTFGPFRGFFFGSASGVGVPGVVDGAEESPEGVPGEGSWPRFLEPDRVLHESHLQTARYIFCTQKIDPFSIMAA